MNNVALFEIEVHVKRIEDCIIGWKILNITSNIQIILEIQILSMSLLKSDFIFS